MSYALYAAGLPVLVYAIALLAWGHEDKKGYEVHVFSVLLYSIVYFVVYIIASLLNEPYYSEFLVIGIAISLIILVVLRKQMSPLDHYVLAMGNIAMPFITIPAFLMSMGITMYRRESSHAYIWIYAISFIVVASLELILLLLTIQGII